MKKIILSLLVTSLLFVSTIYANTTVVIDNKIARNPKCGPPWLDGNYFTSEGGSSFWNLPLGKTTFHWPNYKSATINYISGYERTKDSQHNFDSSPSCEYINILPGIENLIDVTERKISGPVPIRYTFCTVHYIA